MSKTVLGHIDCPSCGAAKGMRVTPDKNGSPFGFCEDGCGQQLRVGGNSMRVRAFVSRYPWAAAPVTVTVPAIVPDPPVPEPEAKPAAVAPVPAPAEKPVKNGWLKPILGG